MQNFLSKIKNILNNTTSRYMLYGIGGLVVLIGSFFLYKEISLNFFVAPQVSGANFSLEYRKIPFDIESIDISFSSDLDESSIDRNNFRIDPFVEGDLSFKSSNTISYKLNQKLEIDAGYLITIKNIKAKHGGKVSKEITLNIETVAGAKATKIIPEGNLQNITQTLTVLFNIPIIPLTSLDNKDKLPCPISISPSIEGKCKWISSNILEFTPDKHWEGATKYEIKIKDTPGLLYKISEEYNTNLITPDLRFFVNKDFNPHKGIVLKSNFPVDLDVLKNNITLKQGNVVKEMIITNVKDENKKDSETQFNILPKNGYFEYSTNYGVTLNNGFKPKYGNINFKGPNTFYVRSSDFLIELNTYQNKFDSGGILKDAMQFNKNIDETNKTKESIIPSTNLFFNLTFGEEISLDNSYFSFEGPSGSETFTISYIKKEIYKGGKKETQENKTKIKFELKNALKADTNYKLKINKKASKALKEDVITAFKTAPDLKIGELSIVDNTSLCLYLNNDLENDYIYYDQEKEILSLISSEPKADFNSIYKYQFYGNSYEKKLCPDKLGFTPYLLSVRFNPHSSYNVQIKSGLKDKYENTLKSDFNKNIKTGEISDKDKYLYSSLNKDINVIPKDIPIIVNLQSINIAKANIEVCELDLDGYLDYTNNYYMQYYTPKCIKKVQKNVDLKNKFWTLSNNKFDLENDIFGSKISSNFILIRGSIDKFNRQQGGYLDYSREFINVYIRSNLSLVLEEAENKSIIFASDFAGKDVLKDLKFEIYDQNGKIYKDIKFDESKLVYETQIKNIKLVIAKNDNYFGIINTKVDSASNYDFKYISGMDASTKDYLYLYTDRPIYRPGDTVFFKGLLRQFNFNGYGKSDIKEGTLKILDENYNFIKEMTVKIDKNSNFNGEFIISKDTKLGRFNFEFYGSGGYESIYNDGHFFVEEYKKPVFKVNLDGDKSDAILGDAINIKLSSEYYFGGKMFNAKYFKGILAQNYFFNSKDYSDYQFGKGYEYFNCIYWGYCNYYDSVFDFGEGETGEGIIGTSGEEIISFNFPNKALNEYEESNGEKIYNFNFTVTDPDTQLQVSKTKSIILHTTDGYVGLKSSYWHNKNDGVKFNGIVLDYDAKPLSGKEVLLRIYKTEWKNIKKQGVDGTFYNEYGLEKILEKEYKLVSNSKGEISDTYITKNDGEYEIRATYTGKNGIGYDSYINTYVSGDSIMEWNNGNNTITDLVAEKSILKVGENASFTLKSPVSSGKMFISIEKDNGILDYFVKDIDSFGPKLNIEVKETYYPNFYVKAFLIGKDNPANPLPIYKRALNVVKVVTDHKKLNVKITTDKKHYLPGQKVNLKINVTDANGNGVANANGSISIVDESLLALKGNPKKNPFAFFYDMKRYLGTITYLSLINLIEKLEIKDIRDGEKGGAGDGVKGGYAQKKRGVFKDTSFWQSNFVTDANGNSSITTTALPDNLTTWNIESVVSTSLDNKVGIGETTIITNKKLMINENIPRFFGSNDKIILSPVVFNKTGVDQIFDVSISSSNLKIKNPNQQILILNGEQEKIEFEGEVTDIGVLGEDSNFVAKINFKAKGLKSGDIDEIEKFVQIKESSTKESVVTTGKTDNVSFEEKIDLTDLIFSSVKLVINYSATLLSNITSGMDYLNNFPYGCSEQKTSALMPNIYIKSLYDTLELPFDLKTKMLKKWLDQDKGYVNISIDETIKNYLSDIEKYQQFNGGFAFWDEKNYYNYSDFNLTSYIVSSVSDIKKLGYQTKEIVFNNAIIYLKSQFYKNQKENCFINNYTNCKYTETERLNSIDAILSYKSNDYETYKMYKILNLDTKDISTKIKEIKVISGLKKLKDLKEQEKNILNKRGIDLVNTILNEYVTINPRGAFLGKDYTYSRLINTASFIEAVSEFGLNNFKNIPQVIDNMNRWLISQKKGGSFGSTQDNIIAIKGFISYIKNSGELENVNMNIKSILNLNIIDEQNVDSKNKLNVFTKNIYGKDIKTSNIFTINKTGKGVVYYDLSLNYYLPTKNIKSRDEGFYVEKIYYDYNEYKKIENMKKEELKSFLSGEDDINKLKYPKNAFEYLTPLKSGKVGQLILVYNKIITAEPKDKVAFEGFIPAGSELVNTNLSTENQGLKFNTIFNYEEFRDDRYFGYKENLSSGIYTFNYIIRLTHAGVFNIKPSKIFEFYNEEVFGRTNGIEFEIK